MIDTINIRGYRIVRELGRGAMAAVYLAIQEKFEREVALKVMSPLLERDPSFAIRFEREVGIVAQLSHSSIVQVIDVDHHDGHHYLVMEYLPGSDLQARIRAGERGLGLALEVCVATASALDLAHSKKLVHRDIKPANILFRQDTTPVLTDFGIAPLMDSSSSLTTVRTLISTLDYMSPEQASGMDLDGRSDLYSLGAVFYEVLTGSVPYSSGSTASVIMKQASDPPRLPPQFAMFQAFIDQIMAKKRDDRHATGGEVIRSLRLAAELANARRSHVIPNPSAPVSLAPENAPTIVAPWAAPSLGDWIGGNRRGALPATETRPSEITLISPEARAMPVAIDTPIDPAWAQSEEPGGDAAQTLIVERPPLHPRRTLVSPMPGTPQALAVPAQNSPVRSLAADFGQTPVWVAIAVGIWVILMGVYLLAAVLRGNAVKDEAGARCANVGRCNLIVPSGR